MVDLINQDRPRVFSSHRSWLLPSKTIISHRTCGSKPLGIPGRDRGNSGVKRWVSSKLSRWTLRQLQSKCWDAQDAEESRPALQALCRLRSPLRVAQEMGKSLDRSQILLGCLPDAKKRPHPSMTANSPGGPSQSLMPPLKGTGL